MSLYSKVKQVTTEEDFINFLRELALDREDELKKEKTSPSSPYSSGVNGWENGRIEDFLGAAASWADASINGLELYKKPENPWTRAAEINYAGKIYE